MNRFLHQKEKYYRSGKSTTAEILSKKYDLYYFKVDDYLDKYMQLGAEKGYEICKKQSCLSGDQIWMRDPMLQCVEEFQWYEEVFEFVQRDLGAISYKNGIITEGAAYLPKLMKGINVPYNRYISVTRKRSFCSFIIANVNLCLIYCGNAVINKRRLRIGWREISFLPKAYSNSVKWLDIGRLLTVEKWQ